MKRLLILIIFTTGCSLAFSQAKVDKIKNLLALTGSAQIGVQMATQMLDNFKQAYPHVPESYWIKVKQEMKPEDLAQMVIPIYDRHFSEADIDSMTAFYSSPVGKKVLSKMPVIIQESQSAGIEWGQKIADKIISELDKTTYSSPPPPMR